MRARARIPARKPGVKTTSFSHRIQKPNSSQSTNSPVDHILSLQGTIGNRAVQRLIKSGALKAKLSIGKHNDICEQGTDRITDQIMLIPEPQLQRQLEEKEGEPPSEEISVSFTTCPWVCDDCDKWEKEELGKDKNERMRQATKNKYKGCRDSATNWESEKVYESLKKHPEFWRIFSTMIITKAVNLAEIKDPKVKAKYDESRSRELWEFYHRSAVNWAWYQAWTKGAE